MIKAIHLKNFKSFVDEGLDLAPLTLLSGMNGIGKSTVIQALLLLRQSHLSRILYKGLSLKGEYLDLGKGKDVLSMSALDEVIEIKIDWQGNDLSSRFSFHYEPDLDILPFTNQPIEESDELSLQDHYVEEPLFKHRFQYLGADRHPPRAFFPASSSKVENEKSLGNRGEYTAHFLNKYQREAVSIPNLVDKNAPANTLISQTAAWMSRISPGIKVKTQLYNDLDVASVRYQYEMDGDTTQEFSPVNTGFGITYVLPVIVAVLAAQKNDLLIIENPESHLHPQGQVVLGELFAKAVQGGVQIIVESHSDHLLHSVCIAVKKEIISPEQLAVFYFQRPSASQDHVTTVVQPQIDQNGRIDRYPEGFLDGYDKLLDELLA